MAKQLILLDTSVLIDYFRKQDKQRSQLLSLVQQGYTLRISAITEFEIYSGVGEVQRPFWEALLERVEVLPFGSAEVHMAVSIQQDLKRARKQLDLPDLFIAATALVNGLPIATLNRKHFERIPKLTVI
jgi:tRNA(fMet)-specific endonuclease VapC